jgi:hypothetical protein
MNRRRSIEMFVDPSNYLELDRLRHEENRPTGTGERMSAPARELAQRLSGGDEVLLLWHPACERVELSIRDLATGAGFQVEVASGDAIDAFYHPYAYAARHENRYRVDRTETRIGDG